MNFKKHNNWTQIQITNEMGKVNTLQWAQLTQPVKLQWFRWYSNFSLSLENMFSSWKDSRTCYLQSWLLSQAKWNIIKMFPVTIQIQVRLISKRKIPVIFLRAKILIGPFNNIEGLPINIMMRLISGTILPQTINITVERVKSVEVS